LLNSLFSRRRLIPGVMLEELLKHVDDRRSSAWRYSLPGAPGVNFLDQLGLDPNIDLCCFLSHAGEMGRCRTYQLDNSRQEIDN
jgi:hypothetical protein